MMIVLLKYAAIMQPVQRSARYPYRDGSSPGIVCWLCCRL